MSASSAASSRDARRRLAGLQVGDGQAVALGVVSGLPVPAHAARIRGSPAPGVLALSTRRRSRAQPNWPVPPRWPAAPGHRHAVRPRRAAAGLLARRCVPAAARWSPVLVRSIWSARSRGLADAGGGDRVGLQVIGHALALAAAVGARDRCSVRRSPPSPRGRSRCGRGCGCRRGRPRIRWSGCSRSGAAGSGPWPPAIAAWVASPLELPPACWASTIAPSMASRIGSWSRCARSTPRSTCCWVTWAISCESTAGHFVLAFGRQHQAGVHADVAAQGGEGVDLPVAQHEEGEGLLRLVAVGAQAAAHVCSQPSSSGSSSM